MSAALKWGLVPADEYLASELDSPVKHEYLAGVLYAMAGASNAHNQVASNTLIAAGSQLRGRPCRAYNSDTKIRVRLPNQVRFYYPDTSVICRSNPPADLFQDEAAVLFEVLARNTRPIDEGEKKDAYLTIPSLFVYVLIEQEEPRVVAFRRTDAGFVREVYTGLDAVLPLFEIGIELPLAEIYDGIVFVTESNDAT